MHRHDRRELAIDGIDERIAIHLATDVPEVPDATLGGVLCLACLDDPAAWTGRWQAAACDGARAEALPTPS